MNRPLAQLDVRIWNADRPFFYRTDSEGDRGVIRQIFEKQEYDLSQFAQSRALGRFYESMLASGRMPLIVDAGANIGASVVYFAGVFPGSRILAIEPEQNNCALLRKNCEGLDYALLEGGIGCAPGSLYLNDPGHSDWGFRLAAHGDYRVPVFGAASLIADEVGEGRVPFICKIDIEGGEAEMFEDNTSWVSSFPLLIVELHDWLLPGVANSRNFLRVIASLNFDFVYRGENVFCFNNDLLAFAAA